MPYSTPKQTVKEVRYLNKDFSGFKSNLMEFAKIYFPNMYNDFHDASPGMMLLKWDRARARSSASMILL